VMAVLRVEPALVKVPELTVRLELAVTRPLKVPLAAVKLPALSILATTEAPLSRSRRSPVPLVPSFRIPTAALLLAAPWTKIPG
jgi:hypothetical protein